MSASDAKPTTVEVIVCAGAGGVGKTTSSLALAWALAESGRKPLLLTVDPARRLAQALGASLDLLPERVVMPAREAHADGAHPIAAQAQASETAIWAWMPPPRSSVRFFLERLFEGNDAGLERLLNSSVTQVLIDDAAGMHEIVCFFLLAEMLPSLDVDVVIVDTAPTRQALDFLTYPKRLSSLLESRSMMFLAELGASLSPASTNTGSSDEKKKRGFFADVSNRTASLLLEKTMGKAYLQDLGNFLAELLTVRPRFLQITERADQLLRGANTHFFLVCAPTDASIADALFLRSRAQKLGIKPEGYFLNRASESLSSVLLEIQEQTNAQAPGLAAEGSRNLLQTLQFFSKEDELRVEETEKAKARLRKAFLPGENAALHAIPYTDDFSPLRVAAFCRDRLLQLLREKVLLQNLSLAQASVSSPS